MNIGIVTATHIWGGAELHTVATAHALADRGHAVTIFQLGHDLYTKHGDIEPRRITAPQITISRKVRQLPARFWRRLFRQHAIDAIILVKGTFENRYRGLDLALLTGRRPRLALEHSFAPEPSVRSSKRHFRGLIPGVGLWYIRERADVTLHRRAFDQVIAVAGAIKQRLIDTWHYADAQVTVVYNGIDLSRYRAAASLRAAVRERWGIPASAFVFGSIGRLAPVKRLDRLLHAFRAVAPGRDAWLVMVGSGPESVALHALATELGISERCVWAGATRTPWESHNGIDCIVSCSESEGLPYALMEAMACERLVVARDAGGTRELVIDNVSGFLATQEPGALEHAMRAAMALVPDARAELGRRACDHVKRLHDERRQLQVLTTAIERAFGVGRVAGTDS